MRRILLAATGVLFAALLIPQASHAVGNVLLPGGSSSSLPNLGLSVTPKTPAPAPAPAPTAEPKKKPEIPAPVTPPKVVEKPPVPAQPAGPTRIITQDEASFQGGENLPYSLTIAVSEKSAVSTSDVAKISDRLGLTHEQVSSSCFLSLRGMLKTDKSLYSIGGRLSPQATVRYDGTIQRYMMTAQAMCLANQIPPKGGIIVKMKDRFIVSLQQVNCKPPESGRPASLIVVYKGSDAAECSYQ
ncbi:MAG: hypothetical protein WC521_05000 [Bdellovibrionales bacterium]